MASLIQQIMMNHQIVWNFRVCHSWTNRSQGKRRKRSICTVVMPQFCDKFGHEKVSGAQLSKSSQRYHVESCGLPPWATLLGHGEMLSSERNVDGGTVSTYWDFKRALRLVMTVMTGPNCFKISSSEITSRWHQEITPEWNDVKW